MIAAFATSGHNPLPVDPGDPPSGDPTNGTTYLYAGTKVGLQWTNGDAAAYTQIGYNSVLADPSSVTAVVSPGVTSYETNGVVDEYWYVRHLKNGQTGNWVRIIAPDEEL